MRFIALKMTGVAAKCFFAIATFIFYAKFIFCKEYSVDFERFESCKEYPNMESPITDVKFVKINRTARAYSFSTDLKRPIDENIGIKVELEKWGSNSWIALPFITLQPDACNLLKKLLGKMWVDIKRYMGVKEPEKCPIPAGHYGMNNYMYDTTNLGYLVPFKGRFRYKIILADVKTEEPVQCVALVLNVADADLNGK